MNGLVTDQLHPPTTAGLSPVSERHPLRRLQGLWHSAGRLRCPACERGALFERGVTLNRACAHCGARFEGGTMGGAALLSMLTTAIALVGCYVTTFGLHWSLWAQLLVWGGFAIGFPLALYRPARALEIGLIHGRRAKRTEVGG